MSSIATKGHNQVGSLRQKPARSLAGRPRSVLLGWSRPLQPTHPRPYPVGKEIRITALPDPIKAVPPDRPKRRDRLLPKTLAVREDCE